MESLDTTGLRVEIQKKKYFLQYNDEMIIEIQ